MNLRDQALASAEAWAEHAYLRSQRTCDDPECKVHNVEDALLMCMLMIWASGEVDG